jgi:hypothetical protein
MVRIYVRHQVADYPAWKVVYDEFDSTRRSMGVIAAEVYQALDDPTDVTVSHDFDTREVAEAFAASDELRGAMTRAGVVGQPTIWFVKEA